MNDNGTPLLIRIVAGIPTLRLFKKGGYESGVYNISRN